jgi:two-component system cell cycle response regulator DivK
VVPIIALTAHAMRGDEERARAAGCDHYLAKPISPKKVVEEVRKILKMP